jgi:predicted nucleic acid-binding protein
LTLVIDASLALAWCLPGEATPRTAALFERVIQSGAFVTAIWRYEVVNGLLRAERRRRTNEAETVRSAELVSGLPLEVDLETTESAFSSVLALARAQGLTVYDAAYLELAMRLVLPLGTNDEPMATAARNIGIEVL